MHLTDVLCLQTRFVTTTEYRYTYLDRYGIPCNGSTFITFQVEACHDAHIALKSPIKGGPIEIVIGGWDNKRSCVRLTPQGNCLETYQGAVLDCNEYRPFTVYWGDGQILLKKGNAKAGKSNIFLNLTLNYPLDDVNVGISTGFGSSGIWMFEDEPASATSRTTECSSFAASSVAVIIGSVGAVIIFGIIVGVFYSFRNCKKNDQSASSETNKNFESERQHGLDQISEHHYDSLSATTNNLELC